MGRICVVEACGSEYYPDCGLSFHRFPKDPNVREIWISIIPMSSTRKLTDASVVCSKHFKAQDFVACLSRPVLKCDAVPSVFLLSLRRRMSLEAEQAGYPARRELQPGAVLANRAGKVNSNAPLLEVVCVKTETDCVRAVRVKEEPAWEAESVTDAHVKKEICVNKIACGNKTYVEVEVEAMVVKEEVETEQSADELCVGDEVKELALGPEKLQPHNTTSAVHASGSKDVTLKRKLRPRRKTTKTPRQKNKTKRIYKGDQLYKCDICDTSCRQKSDLVKHIRIHTGEKPHACDICKTAFRIKSDLLKHIMIHTGEKPHVCEICHTPFRQKCDLVKHVRIHTGEKPYTCGTCEMRFRQQSGLIRHIRTHTGERPYPCETCKKTFRQQSGLMKHIKIHTGEKPYVCDVCKMPFRQKSGLLRHKKIHTGEKPYVCEVCQSAFRENSGLIKHRRIHTGEKPYVCELCNRSFRQNSDLKKHERMHSGEKPYECGVCKKRFCRKSLLMKHGNKVHGRGIELVA